MSSEPPHHPIGDAERHLLVSAAPAVIPQIASNARSPAGEEGSQGELVQALLQALLGAAAPPQPSPSHHHDPLQQLPGAQPRGRDWQRDPGAAPDGFGQLLPPVPTSAAAVAAAASLPPQQWLPTASSAEAPPPRLAPGLLQQLLQSPSTPAAPPSLLLPPLWPALSSSDWSSAATATDLQLSASGASAWGSAPLPPCYPELPPMPLPEGGVAVPLWSAADILPATMGGVPTLPLPLPLPAPDGAVLDGGTPLVFRSRAPRSE